MFPAVTDSFALRLNLKLFQDKRASSLCSRWLRRASSLCNSASAALPSSGSRGAKLTPMAALRVSLPSGRYLRGES